MVNSENSGDTRTVSVQIENLASANKAVQTLLAWRNLCLIVDELGENLIDEGNQVENFYLSATFEVEINSYPGFMLTVVIAKLGASSISIDEYGVMTIECEYTHDITPNQSDEWGTVFADTDVEGSFTYIDNQSMLIRMSNEAQQVQVKTCTVPHS